MAGWELFEDVGESDSRRSLGIALDDVVDPGAYVQPWKRASQISFVGLNYGRGKVLQSETFCVLRFLCPQPVAADFPELLLLERLAIDGGEGTRYRLRGLPV